MKRPEKQMGRQEGEDIIANKLNNTTDALALSCRVVFLVFLPPQMQEE